MKKLKLKAFELAASDVLTREQLKNVLGGDGSGGNSGTECWTPYRCLTYSCVASSGPCKGATGTCGPVNQGTDCACAVVCVG